MPEKHRASGPAGFGERLPGGKRALGLTHAAPRESGELVAHCVSLHRAW